MLLKGELSSIGSKKIKAAIVVIGVAVLLLSPTLSHPTSASFDDYPAKWKNAPIDSTLDDWGMYNRQCTSFVAWRLHSRNGFDMPFHADAYKWTGIARGMGYRVDSIPAVGAVAATGNHVAWVESVDSASATITVEEYNKVDSNGDGIYANDGTYTQRTMPANSAQYIHFKDITPGAQLNFTGSNYKGKMARSSDGTISYVSAKGLRYWAPNMPVVSCLGGSYTQLDQATFNSIGDAADPADCLTRFNEKLIRDPAGSISYVDANGFGHWIPNMNTVACLGGSYTQLDQATYKSITNSQVTAHCDSPYLGRLIRSPDGSVSYVDSNNLLHWVGNSDIVACQGGWGSIINMDQQTYGQFPVSSNASCSTR